MELFCYNYRNKNIVFVLNEKQYRKKDKMVKTATKNSDWLQIFKEDYKLSKKYLKSSSPKEIISKITISDETVSSFEEYQESDLLRDYYIKNKKDLDILSNKVLNLKNTPTNLMINIYF